MEEKSKNKKPLGCAESKSPYFQVSLRFGDRTPYLIPISGYVGSHLADSKLII